MEKVFRFVFAVSVIGALFAIISLMSSTFSHQKRCETSFSPAQSPSATTSQSLATASFELSPSTVQYLKTAENYAPYYNSNKKMVVYFTGMGCPYGQSFADAVSRLSSDTIYQPYYSFVAIPMNGGIKVYHSKEEAKNDGDLIRQCHEFCVINPIKEEIYFLDGVGPEEADKLPSILEQLKNW